MELFDGVNWLAVVGCVVVAMALGFLWYGPLFGKRWSDLQGFPAMSEAEMKAMQSKMMPAYGVMAVGSAVMALVLRATLHATAAESIGAAIVVAFLLWLAFVATSTLGTAMFSQQNKQVWLINQGFVLTEMVLMAIILAQFS